MAVQGRTGPGVEMAKAGPSDTQQRPTRTRTRMSLPTYLTCARTMWTLFAALTCAGRATLNWELEEWVRYVAKPDSHRADMCIMLMRATAAWLITNLPFRSNGSAV